MEGRSSDRFNYIRGSKYSAKSSIKSIRMCQAKALHRLLPAVIICFPPDFTPSFRLLFPSSYHRSSCSSFMDVANISTVSPLLNIVAKSYLLDYILTYTVRGKGNFSCHLKKKKVTFLLYTGTLQGQITVLSRFGHATIVGQHKSFSFHCHCKFPSHTFLHRQDAKLNLAILNRCNNK